MPVHIGEAEITPSVVVGKPLVVKTQKVEQGGLQVVNAHRVLCDMEPEVIGRAVGGTGFHATPGHPQGIGLRVVVAPLTAAQAEPVTRRPRTRP